MKLFSYAISGRDGNKNAWHVEGTVESQTMVDAPMHAIRDAFPQIMKDKTCLGPYAITRVLVEEVS